MNHYNLFIDKLIEMSQSLEMRWTDYFDFSHYMDGEGLDVLFFQGEYRRIEFLNSFISELPDFFVAVIDEVIESGKDGSVTEGIHLYLLEKKRSTVHRVPATQEKVMELHKVAGDYNLHVNFELDVIIQKFLQTHSDHQDA